MPRLRLRLRLSATHGGRFSQLAVHPVSSCHCLALRLFCSAARDPPRPNACSDCLRMEYSDVYPLPRRRRPSDPNTRAASKRKEQAKARLNPATTLFLMLMVASPQERECRRGPCLTSPLLAHSLARPSSARDHVTPLVRAHRGSLCMHPARGLRPACRPVWRGEAREGGRDMQRSRSRWVGGHALSPPVACEDQPREETRGGWLAGCRSGVVGRGSGTARHSAAEVR